MNVRNSVGAFANLELERLIAHDADYLTVVLGLASERMLVREREHHDLTQSPQAIPFAEPPVTTTSSVSLGSSLSHAGERPPGRYGDAGSFVLCVSSVPPQPCEPCRVGGQRTMRAQGRTMSGGAHRRRA